MSTEAFGIEKEFLHDILKHVRDGKAQLPEFQRDWVWPDTNIASLLASVSQSYPIGTVMMLQTGGASVKFKQRPIEGATPPAGVKASRLILDGQQRLTSLYQALLLDRAVKAKNERDRPIEVWFYIDMRKALANGADREDAIVALPADRKIKNFRGEVLEDYSTADAEYKSELFPLNRVFEAQKWRAGYNKHWNYDQAHTEMWDRFEAEVVDRFKQYQIPVIELGADTRRQAVCQVFEKVNTGGVTLTVFELLTATFAADEFDLRKDWEERQRQIKTPERRILKDFSNTDYLQAITLLATREARLAAQAKGEDDERAPRVGCKRTDMLDLSLDSYRRWAADVVEGLKRCAQFLHTLYVFDPKFLPYGGQLVPLAAIFAALGHEADNQAARDKLQQYYWCGVFGELYGGTTETRFSRDVIDVPDWIRSGQEPRTVTEAAFMPVRLLTLRSRNSAAYKGLYALLLRAGARDWRTGIAASVMTYFDEATDIHHIFPKKWCMDNGIAASRYDSIVNKTPLSARTNRVIGGRAPSDYLQRLANSTGIDAATLDNNVSTHFVDTSSLRADAFDACFEARRDELARQIGVVMGKPVILAPAPPGDEPDITYTEVAEDDDESTFDTIPPAQ
jgi:hypothetical protein